MVSATAHHPGIEKDPDELATHDPGLVSVKPGKREGRAKACLLTPTANMTFPVIFPADYLVSIRAIFPVTITADGFSGTTTPEMKREYGEAYPKGTETVAAPATVSGERRLMMPLIGRSGRQGEAETREPGDLPSILKFEPDGVCRERCDVSVRCSGHPYLRVCRDAGATLSAFPDPVP